MCINFILTYVSLYILVLVGARNFGLSTKTTLRLGEIAFSIAFNVGN